MLGSFGANMLMLGHADVQAPRHDTRYRTFHVKLYRPTFIICSLLAGRPRRSNFLDFSGMVALRTLR